MTDFNERFKEKRNEFEKRKKEMKERRNKFLKESEENKERIEQDTEMINNLLRRIFQNK